MQKMKSLKERKLYLRVYDELRNYIQDNRLQPGDKLPTEMEMCSFLGVSRNVLREAVKALEITGVVRSRPGVGIIIQETSLENLFSNVMVSLAGNSEDSYLQTLEVRRALELGFSVQAYENLSKEQYQEMCKQIEAMEKIFSKLVSKNHESATFGQAFRDADAQFHKALFSGIDNAILHSMMNAVWIFDAHHTMTVPVDYIGKTIERHKSMLKALNDNDLPAFLEAIQTHFDFYKPIQDEANIT